MQSIVASSTAAQDAQAGTEAASKVATGIANAKLAWAFGTCE